jgi:hypothetical protein
MEEKAALENLSGEEGWLGRCGLNFEIPGAW